MPNPNPPHRPTRSSSSTRESLPKYVSRFGDGYRLRRPGQKAVYAKTLDELVAPPTVRRFDPTMTVDDWFAAWLPKLNLRENSRDGHAYNVRTYLSPLFGHYRLTQLDRDMIRDKLRSIRGRNDRVLAPRTIALAHATLRRALQTAVDDGYLAANPAVRLGLLPRGAAGRQKLPGVELPIPDQATVRQLIAASRDSRWSALLVLSVATGLRQSEALGLTWSDVDLDGRQLHVRRAMVRGRKTFDDPKNVTSRRTVGFHPAVAAALRAHRQAQLVERVRAGDAWSPEPDLVFTSELGNPADARSINRWFHRICDRAGVRRYRWHDLRHAYATGAWSQGVTIEEISKTLGHASLDITTRVYAHLMPDRSTRIGELVGDAFLTDADEPSPAVALKVVS